MFFRYIRNNSTRIRPLEQTFEPQSLFFLILMLINFVFAYLMSFYTFVVIFMRNLNKICYFKYRI